MSARRRTAPQPLPEESADPSAHDREATDAGESGSLGLDMAEEDDADVVESSNELPPTEDSSDDPRAAKMRELRKRMQESSRANRKDVVEEARRSHTSAREAARLERKKAQAAALGEKAAAAEAGEDLERKRAWDYSIEDNDKWEKKLKRKRARGDFAFTDYDDMARRKYKKDVDALKPDFAAYNRQRRAAAGLDLPESGLGGPSSDLLASSSGSAIVQQRAAEDLYRDANSFEYADHKPSDDAIDRVVGKLNADIDKRNKHSRVRGEDDGDITYINEKNKLFNRKLQRHFEKHTAEVRASFERGTAL